MWTLQFEYITFTLLLTAVSNKIEIACKSIQKTQKPQNTEKGNSFNSLHKNQIPACGLFLYALTCLRGTSELSANTTALSTVPR